MIRRRNFYMHSSPWLKVREFSRCNSTKRFWRIIRGWGKLGWSTMNSSKVFFSASVKSPTWAFTASSAAVQDKMIHKNRHQSSPVCSSPLEAARCFTARGSTTAARTMSFGFVVRDESSTSFVVQFQRECKSSTATSERYSCPAVTILFISTLSPFRVSFLQFPKVERQAKLSKDFGFMCDCEACSGNFPTPPALKSKDAKLFKVARKADKEVVKLLPHQAMRKFREFCDILEKCNQSYPSVELCLLQKCIVTCLVKQAQPSTLFPWIEHLS